MCGVMKCGVLIGGVRLIFAVGLRREEFVNEWMAEHDLNKDGKVTFEEFKKCFDRIYK